MSMTDEQLQPQPPLSHVPPPRFMQSVDPTEADEARRRVRSPNKRFSWAHAHVRRRHDSTASSLKKTPSTTALTNNDLAGKPVDLPDSSGLPKDESKDMYRWAVLYENQRGMTIFSTPYYSSLSLLPNDPAPFTVPEARPDVRQPKVSLDEYPLPDGNWRWVSKAWMIDMRGDGAVSYDGFEYNWLFRRHKWSPMAPTAGGWVRRRRWVRLMVKPANPARPTINEPPPSQSQSGSHAGGSAPNSSHPPSIISSRSGSEQEWNDMGEVWRGDPEEDWTRCHALLKRVGRDGRRIELWKTWLGSLLDSDSDSTPRTEGYAPRDKQWTEDSGLLPFEVEAADTLHTSRPVLNVDRQAIATVIKAHGQEIVHSFVYPDSRAQFLALLARARILEDIVPTAGMDDGAIANMADFWSYTHDIGDKA